MAAVHGATPHKLDTAGRLKLRDEERVVFGDSLIMSCGFDNCISFSTVKRWEKFVADFDELSQQDPDAHDLRRLLVATAEECDVDGQGRVKLPEFLMRWANLGEPKLQAYLIPTDEGWWECWEAERYQKFLTERALELKQKARGFWTTPGATRPGETASD
jgi:MraZ protein